MENIEKDEIDRKDEKRLISFIRELILGILVIFGTILIILSFKKNNLKEVNELFRSIGLTIAPAGVITLFLSRYADYITGITIKKTIQIHLEKNFQEFEIAMQKNLTNKIEICVNDNFNLIKNILDEQKNKIETRLNSLTPSFSLLSSGTKYGVENVHLNRAQALESFNWFLDSEIKKSYENEESRIWIVSSSIKGLLTIVTDHFDGKRFFEKLKNTQKVNIQILMTHPEFANYRANQEKRQPGEIPHEIGMNISILKNYGIKKEMVKFYRGTPTVFGIATSDRMLLNPYPYQSEAFRCFSLIVLKTNNVDEDIFHQYLKYHFQEPWEKAEILSNDDWEKN
jgi:hypothetical protein